MEMIIIHVLELFLRDKPKKMETKNAGHIANNLAFGKKRPDANNGFFMCVINLNKHEEYSLTRLWTYLIPRILMNPLYHQKKGFHEDTLFLRSHRNKVGRQKM